MTSLFFFAIFTSLFMKKQKIYIFKEVFDMKKIIKVTGKLIKWYMKLNIVMWAFVGIAELVDVHTKNPHIGWYEADDEVLINAWNKYKNYFVRK